MISSKKDSLNIKVGVLLSYLALAISVIGSLFISNRVLNLIGDYNYGLYSFVNSITTWLTIISSALTSSYLRFTTQEASENGSTALTNTIYLKILSFIGIAVIVVGLSLIGMLFSNHCLIGKYDWDDSALMYTMFALSIVNIGLSMPCTIFSLYINFRKKFIFGKTVSIIITVLTFGGNFLIAFFSKNVILISLYTICLTLINLLFNSIYSFKALRIDFKQTFLRENRQLVTAILSFSGILLFNSIVDQVNSNVDKTLLGIFSIPENITVYQMGQQIASYLTVMSISLSNVFSPSIHELVINHDDNGLNNLFLKVSRMQIVILCCVAFGFLACGQNFIYWWIGESRSDAYIVCATLMIISLAPLTMNLSIEIQRARNKHLFRAITYLFLAIANICLSILMLVLLDKDKAIYACLTGTVITTVISHWILMNVYNKTKMKLPIGKYMLFLFVYIVVGLASSCVSFVLSHFYINHLSISYFLKFVIQGFSFVFVYGFIFVLINARRVSSFLKRHISKQ